ncbi:phage regulatory CII family protein [Solidesulfovibrio sp.]
MLKKINDFKLLMHRVVIEEPKGPPAKAVAEELGKPQFTLYRELNPDDDGAKLDAAHLLPIMLVTGDDRPLQFLAGHMGKRVVDMDRRPDARDMAEECLQAYPAVTAFVEAARGDDAGLVGLGVLLETAVGEFEDIYTRWREQNGEGRSRVTA